MQPFLISLQFLTRIRLVEQTEWKNEDFGKSVAWFPVVGWVIGAILCLLYGMLPASGSPLFGAAVLVVGELLLTGALLYDGLMDAADGLFSGRSRERILEIMKDSTVGAFGLMAFVLVLFMKIVSVEAVYRDLPLLLMAMPTVGRLNLVISVVRYPYARPYGIGHSFATYAPRYALPMAVITTLLPALYFGHDYLVLVGAGVLFGLALNGWVVRKIGGTTGDTYGFVTEMTEAFLAIVFVFLVKGLL